MIVTADGTTTVAGGVLFSVVSATDWVDGFLARRLHAESRLGRILDPLADRLVIAVGLVGLIVLERLPWPAPAILLARDAISIAAFVVLVRRGIVMRVDMAGKVSSSLAMIATALALIVDQTWVDWVFWAAVAVAVVTLANYARTARTALRTQAEALRHGAPQALREG